MKDVVWVVTIGLDRAGATMVECELVKVAAKFVHGFVNTEVQMSLLIMMPPCATLIHRDFTSKSTDQTNVADNYTSCSALMYEVELITSQPLKLNFHHKNMQFAI